MSFTILCTSHTKGWHATLNIDLKEKYNDLVNSKIMKMICFVLIELKQNLNSRVISNSRMDMHRKNK